VVDYVRYWSERTGISYRRIVQWIGIPRSKFYQWQQRYGRVNEHNAWIPRDFWLRDEEKPAGQFAAGQFEHRAVAAGLQFTAARAAAAHERGGQDQQRERGEGAREARGIHETSGARQSFSAARICLTRFSPPWCRT